ncbi:class I histocompatibility antigen, F10 alpha chain-like [Sinocyclocheilus rhinocerous]|uniref:class I histocompatibility antigen, F10 alpha chain-like n=1 Tax=Sinocyclocheilus rhinocerous TaxID=307959 RepID=UPI0007BAC37C|nr:PREDICTED: class I histocompatibility antigen, F10 alpha chain-like [Sinocyclocheilus rhinocerous]
MDKNLLLFVLLLPTAASKGSHSLWLLATYIKGQSPFPKFGITYMLDDIIIGYYDSERKLHLVRGNTTEDDDTFGENYHMDIILRLLQYHYENFYYSLCMETLKGYLKKRGNQVNRKVKPRVRLIQKANSDSGGFRVSCLATGFYPRHINLTLFRDKQSVADHEITGGDLLPNADGTYQMRKSLEIRAADKHKYTCSATHLSLDNKLDVTLEFEFKSMIPSILIVLALVLMFGTGAVIYKWKQGASSKSAYFAASSEESLKTSTHKTQQEATQMKETS